MIEGPSSIYFAGDTGFFAGMADLQGRADIALLPIGRWGPHPGPGHLDADGAATVAGLISARVVVPIHWGTLYPRGLDRAYRRPLTLPAVAFAAAMAGRFPGIDARILVPGATTEVSLPKQGVRT